MILSSPQKPRILIESRRAGIFIPSAIQNIVFILLFASQMIGCHSFFNNKKKEEENKFVKETKRIKEMMNDPDRPRLVGEVSTVTRLNYRQYDALGLVTGLEGTGGKVKPSQQRDMILDEMKVIGVNSPEELLDAPWTSLTKVRVFGNPGDADNEVVDAIVEISSECSSTDLMGGNLLEARLREMVVIGGKIRSSGEKAIASGSLTMLPASFTKKEYDPKRAIIVGGGRILEPMQIELVLNSEYRHVYVVNSLQKALNQRFYFHDSKQHMMAEGKSDSRIVVTTVPKYRWDPSHFSSVILACGFAESTEEQKERLVGCKKLLSDRTTARRAAAELEAMGDEAATEILLNGLSSVDTEIRFHSAYALAYLDRPESIPVLVEICKSQPAFRPLCLVGLTINEKPQAREALVQLLQHSEPEVRFGAYVAIERRDANDPLLGGESLTAAVKLVQIPSPSSLVAVSLHKKQEIILFGSTCALQVSRAMSPTNSVSIVPIAGEKLRLTKRYTGDVISTIVDSDLLSLLRGLGTLNATYNDYVQSLDQLQEKKYISVKVAFDPRPLIGRVFVREDVKEDELTKELVSVDSTTRVKEKSSWWKAPSWLHMPKKDSAEEPSVSSSLKTNSMAKDPFDEIGKSNRLSSEKDLELPEIDWDDIR